MRNLADFRFKTNICDREQHIIIQKEDLNINFSNLDEQDTIRIGLPQLLNELRNGNYYLFEILHKLDTISFSNPQDYEFLKIIKNFTTITSNTHNLVRNMCIYLINENGQNQYIYYTLWKLAFIYSGHIFFEVQDSWIDKEIKGNIHTDLKENIKKAVKTFQYLGSRNQLSSNNKEDFDNLSKTIIDNY